MSQRLRQRSNCAAQLHPDYVVLSVAALSAGGGCLEFDPFEVEFKQVACPQAGTVILVADASRFEALGLIASLAWERVQVMVTDRAPGTIWGRLCPASAWCWPKKLTPW